MKKIIITAIICFSAFLSAMAQNTAEAILGLCPPFPTQSQLVGYGVGEEGDADVEAIIQYLDMLDKAIEQAKIALDKRAKNSNIEGKSLDIADAQTKHQTGKSISEIQAMGDAGAERFAKGKANKQLKSLGINKSVAELENRELSQAEQNQMANNMAQQMSGMSLSELQAMAAKIEGMSEEEQAAYMQNSGMLDRITKNAQKTKPAVSQKVTSELSGQISQSGYNALQVWTERWNKWTKRMPVLKEELDKKWISMGYYSRCKSWRERSVPTEFIRTSAPKNSVAYFHELEKAAHDYDVQVRFPAIKAIESEYLSNVSIKDWYPFIMEGLNLLKQRTQIIAFDYETLSDYEKEIHNITMAQFAIDYLEYAKKLAEFPRGNDPIEDNN